MGRAVQETLYSEEDLKVMFGMFDLTRRGWISKQQYSQGAHRLLYLIGALDSCSCCPRALQEHN